MCGNKFEFGTGLYLKIGKNKQLAVDGRLGSFTMSVGGKDICVNKDNSVLFFYSKASFRTFMSIFLRAIKGVDRGYYYQLNFVGLGYRFIFAKNRLLLKLGFAHYIELYKPDDLHIFGYKKNMILFGTNYANLNNFIASLLKFQKQDNYKGKGIRRYGVPLKLKVGKQKL